MLQADQRRGEVSSTIVYCPTISQVETVGQFLADRLGGRKAVAVYHGSRDQGERTMVRRLLL